MRVQKRTSVLGLIVVAVGLTSCSSASEPQGRTGNLGNGVFLYECQDTSDPACSGGTGNMMPGCAGQRTVDWPGTAREEQAKQCFPSRVGLGARFRIQYRASSEAPNPGNPVIKPIAPSFLQLLGDGVFEAKRLGQAGLYAVGSTNGQLYDYTLVKVEPLGSIRLTAPDDQPIPTQVNLRVGDTKEMRATAFSLANAALAGSLPYAWTVSDDRVAVLETGSPSATLRVRGVAPGSAKVSAKVGSSETSTLVTVTP